MMSTPTNTHAGLFTLIPKRIKKKWSPKVYNFSTKSIIPAPALRHESSIITGVTLEVTFDETLTSVRDVFTDDDDAAADQTAAWNEARKDWIALDTAIEGVLTSFAERLTRRADEHRVTTGDVLTSRRTVVVRATSEDKENPPSDAPPVSKNAYAETEISTARTVKPSDSFSVAPQRSRRSAPVRTMGFMDFVRT
jgi:hypothetical protein